MCETWHIYSDLYGKRFAIGKNAPFLVSPCTIIDSNSVCGSAKTTTTTSIECEPVYHSVYQFKLIYGTESSTQNNRKQLKHQQHERMKKKKMPNWIWHTDNRMMSKWLSIGMHSVDRPSHRYGLFLRYENYRIYYSFQSLRKKTTAAAVTADPNGTTRTPYAVLVTCNRSKINTMYFHFLLTSCRLKTNAKRNRWSEKETCEMKQYNNNSSCTQFQSKATFSCLKTKQKMKRNVNIILIKQILEFHLLYVVLSRFFFFFFFIFIRTGAIPMQWDMLKDNTEKCRNIHFYVNRWSASNEPIHKNYDTPKWYLLSYNKNRGALE